MVWPPHTYRVGPCQVHQKYSCTVRSIGGLQHSNSNGNGNGVGNDGKGDCNGNRNCNSDGNWDGRGNGEGDGNRDGDSNGNSCWNYELPTKLIHMCTQGHFSLDGATM